MGLGIKYIESNKLANKLDTDSVDIEENEIIII